MPATPEGKVKQKVKTLLKKYGVYFDMPVPGGFGKSGLDFHCIHHGYALVIETKAPGKMMTDRQRVTAQEIRAAGAPVMVVSSKIDLDLLKAWLQGVCDHEGCKMHPIKHETKKTTVVWSDD